MRKRYAALLLTVISLPLFYFLRNIINENSMTVDVIFSILTINREIMTKYMFTTYSLAIAMYYMTVMFVGVSYVYGNSYSYVSGYFQMIMLRHKSKKAYVLSSLLNNLKSSVIYVIMYFILTWAVFLLFSLLGILKPDYGFLGLPETVVSMIKFILYFNLLASAAGVLRDRVSQVFVTSVFFIATITFVFLDCLTSSTSITSSANIVRASVYIGVYFLITCALTAIEIKTMKTD